ncbi:hypothetical protein [Chryseobacterium lathyri]|uniref:hypothetical protein n=1 Tax=Chryseobacterium lathyri TaxID=395933 RepID=UPI00278819D0|nr:hypothetical protein [Chryseobacterium lathyri]MDQ0065355.1 hypothetical protein [Chryseobacterium lathyri]
MDITKSIRKAVNSNTYWKHGIFQSVVNALSIDYQVDIEIYAEKFATLISDKQVIGYIYLNYPIIFLESKYSSQIHSILNNFSDIQYIIVNTLYDQCLSIDEDIYATYFDYMGNPEAFSAEDFYFYNVRE